MKNLFKLSIFFLSLIIIYSINTKSASAQEYVEPILLIPSDKTDLIDQYQQDLPKVYTSLKLVQQKYSELLGGPTFKLIEPRIMVLDQTSSQSLSSIGYSQLVNRILNEYIQFFDTDNKIFIIWMPGLEGHIEAYNSNGSQISAKTAGANGKFRRGDKILNVIWLPESNFQKLVLGAYGDVDNGELKTAAHEIGHAYGLNHPCTVETTAWCTKEQAEIQPLAPSDDAQKSIMGYNSTPFSKAVFNNSIHNPDIKTLMENPFINPEGKPYPPPDDVYLYKEGVALQSTQVNLYPGSKSPIRIAGKMFGSEKGKVELTLNFTGFGYEQTIEAPEYAIDWSNELITVSLQEEFMGSPYSIKVTIVTPSGKKIPVDGEIALFVGRQNNLTSSSPDPARNGNEVTISGDNFGDAQGEIVFPDFSSGKPLPSKLTILNWSNNQITAYIPQNNTSPTIPVLILPANRGGFFGSPIQIEQNNQVTQDIFFRVYLQCSNPNLQPKPGDVGVYIDNNLGTLTPSSSGFTDSNGRISFLIPVTFDYGNPKNITFTLNRNGQTIDKRISVYPSTQDADIQIDDPSCTAPAETAFDSYSVLISNNPSYNDNDFYDGSGTLQLAGQSDERTIDWIPSSQGDQTIFISKITLDGNQEFQITGSSPGDIVDIPNTNIKLLINSVPRQSTAPDAQIIEEQPIQELAAPPACNPQPWSNKDTNGLYRCDGNQACYVQWQENSDNSCQPQEIGEYCEYNDDCDSRQNTSEPLDALAPNEEGDEGQDQLEEL